jgi:hypothetical protein
MHHATTLRIMNFFKVYTFSLTRYFWLSVALSGEPSHVLVNSTQNMHHVGVAGTLLTGIIVKSLLKNVFFCNLFFG